MKSRRGSTSSPISIVNTRSASMASSICTLQQAAHGRVHRRFPQLARGSSRPGPCSAGGSTTPSACAHQPGHRGCGSRPAFCSFCRFALAAACTMASAADQAVEGDSGTGFSASHSRRRARSPAVMTLALDVAVVPAADAQQVLVGAHVELGFDHLGVVQRLLAAPRALASAASRASSRSSFRPSAMARSASTIHPVAQPFAHAGWPPGTCRASSSSALAADGLAACHWRHRVQHGWRRPAPPSAGRRRVRWPSFRYCSCRPCFTLYSGGCAM